jgi:hypothetical protein
MNGNDRGSVLLKATRVWLPLAIAAGGIVLVVAGRAQTKHTITVIGVLLWLVALIVWMINWLFRMSVESNRDREREEESRRFFDEHGYWPDE